MSVPTIATFFEHDEPEVKKPAGTLLATDIKVTGQPLDPTHIGRIIKPRELVDIIELTPLNRSETILYNQLLAHAWNNIKTQPVHKVLKASLRGRISAQWKGILGPIQKLGEMHRNRRETS